jgi:hypothetical protein
MIRDVNKAIILEFSHLRVSANSKLSKTAAAVMHIVQN